MKLNLLPLLTGAIALTLVTAPTIVQAQSGEIQTQRNLLLTRQLKSLQVKGQN